MALRDIKEKIASVKKTAKVTKAMESVSAVKMRKAQVVALQAREYAFFAFWALKRLAQASGKDISQYFASQNKTDGNKVAIVIVSSDKGLAGAMNTNLFKAFNSFVVDQGLSQEQISAITVGKKAFEFTKRYEYENLHHITQLGEADELDVFSDISRQVMDLYATGEYKSVYVLHTKFITTTEQVPLVRQVLPITEQGLKGFISEIIPKKGKYADKAGEYDFDKKVSGDYKFEPDAETVFRNMIPYLVTTSLYYALLESNASEHSARMVAMKNATDKAGEVAKDLKRTFNRQRQAAITREISEITSGMETTQQ